VASAILGEVDAAFRLDAADAVARYDDAKRGIGRRVRVDAGQLVAVRLSGDTAAESWLRDWLLAGQDVAMLRSALLMPTAKAPQGFAPRGRVVCTCFDIAENQLRTCLAAARGTADTALREVQQSLACGTNCGSCLPELKRLAAETRDAATSPMPSPPAAGAKLDVAAR
jgi:assimilatory nitrate reductase catalytic subunit